MIEAYLHALLDLIAASPVVRASDVTLAKRASRVGLIRGDLYFTDGSRPDLSVVLREIEAIHPLIL